MTDNDLETDRDQFCTTATGYWTAIHDADADTATAQTEAGEQIVDRWAAAGQAGELLGPLLESPVDQIRYAAAAHLLRLGIQEDRSVEVLEELKQDPDGLIAPTARLLLMQRKRRPE